MSRRIIGIVVLLIVVGGGGFLAGRVSRSIPAPDGGLAAAGVVVSPSAERAGAGNTSHGRHFPDGGLASLTLRRSGEDGELARVARVIDGDTIELAGGERVRYIGVDTPESVDPRKPVQCFGVEAARRNRDLVEGKDVRLERDISDRDRYGRLLRYVFLPAVDSSKAGGGDALVNEVLVREGYASVYTFPPDVKYSERFLVAEREAREAKRGLWASCPSGTADQRGQDADLRGSITTDTEVRSNIGAGCRIKGNVGAGGERIYHLPNCPYYEKTRIDEARGERWFCSESEASEAGWRKAKNCPSF